MKKVSCVLTVLLLTVALFWSMDAQASGAGEDQIIGIVERVLNVIADFFDRIFQSIADAVRSVWTPSEK